MTIERRRPSAGSRATLALALALLATTAACQGPSRPVTRVVAGEPTAGRYVPVAAYATYAVARHLELRGDLEGAAGRYRQLLAMDPTSRLARTRLAATLCQLDPPLADRHFATVQREAPTFAPAALERARCLDDRGQLPAAVRAGETAVALDPLDVETNVLLARLLAKAGRRKRARRLLVGLTAARPRARLAWHALETHLPDDDPLRRLVAERHGAPLVAGSSAPRRPASRGPSPVRRALARGEIESARRLATRARMPLAEFALEALRLGRGDVAAEEATLLSRVDPTDPDAVVLRIVLGDLQHDDAALRAALRDAAELRRPPSRALQAALADLLERRGARPSR